MPEDFQPMLKPVQDGETRAGPLRPALPVPGFWGRAAAFAVDFGLPALVCYLGAHYAYETLYPIRWSAQALAPLAVFVYFWIGSSGVTGGQTLGKAVMGYRTLALDGGPLPLGRAALRAALLQLVVAVCAMAMAVVQGRQMVHTPHLTLGFYASAMLVYAVAASYAAAAAVFCGLHPKKRALHDLVAGSMVVRVGDEAEAGEFTAGWDAVCASRLKLAIYPAVAIALAPPLVLGQSYRASREQLEADLTPVAAARGRFEAPGFRLFSLSGPSERTREEVAKFLERREAEHRELVEAGAEEKARRQARWTDEFRKHGPDGRKFIFRFDCDARHTTETLTRDVGFLAIRDQAPAVAEDLAPEFFTADDDSPAPYGAIQLEFSETLPLYLYSLSRLVRRELVPLAAGTGDRMDTPGRDESHGAGEE